MGTMRNFAADWQNFLDAHRVILNEFAEVYEPQDANRSLNELQIALLDLVRTGNTVSEIFDQRPIDQGRWAEYYSAMQGLGDLINSTPTLQEATEQWLAESNSCSTATRLVDMFAALQSVGWSFQTSAQSFEVSDHAWSNSEAYSADSDASAPGEEGTSNQGYGNLLPTADEQKQRTDALIEAFKAFQGRDSFIYTYSGYIPQNQVPNWKIVYDALLNTEKRCKSLQTFSRHKGEDAQTVAYLVNMTGALAALVVEQMRIVKGVFNDSTFWNAVRPAIHKHFGNGSYTQEKILTDVFNVEAAAKVLIDARDLLPEGPIEESVEGVEVASAEFPEAAQDDSAAADEGTSELEASKMPDLREIKKNVASVLQASNTHYTVFSGIMFQSSASTPNHRVEKCKDLVEKLKSWARVGTELDRFNNWTMNSKHFDPARKLLLVHDKTQPLIRAISEVRTLFEKDPTFWSDIRGAFVSPYRGYNQDQILSGFDKITAATDKLMSQS